MGGPHNKDYSILGSILGIPNFGKLPYAEPSPTVPKHNISTHVLLVLFYGFFKSDATMSEIGTGHLVRKPPSWISRSPVPVQREGARW